MNPGYHYDYRPVMRSPRLFHNHTGLSRPTYNSAQAGITKSTNGLYFPYPTNPYRPQLRQTFQSPILNKHPLYACYPTLPQAGIPSPVPFSIYSLPDVTYASTISSKGLAIILIAILMLAALDLVIVRPQKMRSLVRSTKPDGYQLP